MNPLIKIINIVALLIVPLLPQVAGTAPTATPAAQLAPVVATMVEASAPTPATLPAPAAAAVPAPARLYFEKSKADLPADAAQTLAPLVAAAQAGATLSVSGFHDAKGRPEKNAALAKQRAQAVAVALRAAGVPDERIALKKPEQLNGGEAAEARRVEVAVAP